MSLQPLSAEAREPVILCVYCGGGSPKHSATHGRCSSAVSTNRAAPYITVYFVQLLDIGITIQTELLKVTGMMTCGGLHQQGNARAEGDSRSR